ncbi:MAG TPA: hypothetical protein DDW52_15625 [Planctomycetaceae bacterium]|nr:hypothetical protein [Planctomycetaceae bacterium]
MPPNSTPDPEQDSEQANNSDSAGQTPQVENATAGQVQRFVSTVKDMQTQIGEHVLAALQHEGTVAVVTSVVVGPGGKQHIVSAALDPQQAAVVNGLLAGAHEQRVEEEQCVGFHCLVKPKDGTAK